MDRGAFLASKFVEPRLTLASPLRGTELTSKGDSHHSGAEERPRIVNLTQGLHRAAQQRPDGIATVCAGRTRTHRESVDRIARLAAGLTEMGVENGERAAILSLNSDRYHEFLAATLWAGGVVVPGQPALEHR